MRCFLDGVFFSGLIECFVRKRRGQFEANVVVLKTIDRRNCVIHKVCGNINTDNSNRSLLCSLRKVGNINTFNRKGKEKEKEECSFRLYSL